MKNEVKKVNNIHKNKNFILKSITLLFFTSFLFFSLASHSLAAKLVNPDSWLYQKRINLSGTGSDETNYIIPINIHYGPAQGDTSATDIFLDGKSKTDFSDIRFTDSAGNLLPYYMAGSSNSELIYDNNRVAGRSIVASDGTIWGSKITGVTGIGKSTDDGTSWTVMYNVANSVLLFVDSSGYIYVRDGYLLKRSTDQGISWTTVLDLTSIPGYIGGVINASMGEDSSGNLYAGRYHLTSIYNPAIYKSIDHGATWNVVWDSSLMLPLGSRQLPTALTTLLFPLFRMDIFTFVHMPVCQIAPNLLGVQAKGVLLPTILLHGQKVISNTFMA